MYPPESKQRCKCRSQSPGLTWSLGVCTTVRHGEGLSPNNVQRGQGEEAEWNHLTALPLCAEKQNRHHKSKNMKREFSKMQMKEVIFTEKKVQI